MIPCTSSATLTFSFGYATATVYQVPTDECDSDGTAFVLQPSDYIIGPAAGDRSLCLSWPKALPPSADGIDWQLGKINHCTLLTTFKFEQFP